ncbi:hypothetical protein VTI74DRAFT_2150 [Chaetomium olivicolor]
MASIHFEALPYCLGGRIKERAIHVRGAPLPTTRTLFSFLRRLRHPTQRRGVWTDAVCINQEDEEEKGHQIALMARIYTFAARVLVDLGQETLDNALVLELLGRLWRKHFWSGVSADSYKPFSSRRISRRHQGQVLETLTLVLAGLGWFKNFALGKEVMLICGKRRYEWQNIIAATYPFVGGNLPRLANDYSKRGRTTFLFTCVLRQILVLRKTVQGGEFLARTHSSAHLRQKFQEVRLIDGLYHFRICEATIDKDRYVALLSVVDDVVKDGHPRLELNYAAPVEQTLLQRDPRIPSWVQDFPGSQEPIEMMDQTIANRGEQAGAPGDSTSRYPYFNGERVTAAACATMIWGTRIYTNAYSDLEEGFHVLSWVSAARNNKQAVNWALARVIKHFGIAPDEARQGCLDCYVHGFMNGEVVEKDEFEFEQLSFH